MDIFKNLKFSESMQLAFYVLIELDKMTHKEDVENKDIQISGFVNCREQGFFIWNLSDRKACCIAQQRNGAGIVVYLGCEDNFCYQTHRPISSKDYDDMRNFFNFFESNEEISLFSTTENLMYCNIIEKAARFIYRNLIK